MACVWFIDEALTLGVYMVVDPDFLDVLSTYRAGHHDDRFIRRGRKKKRQSVALKRCNGLWRRIAYDYQLALCGLSARASGDACRDAQADAIATPSPKLRRICLRMPEEPGSNIRRTLGRGCGAPEHAIAAAAVLIAVQS